jgi:preprotein translocase subunit SecE
MSDNRLLGFVWLAAAALTLLVFMELVGWAFAIAGIVVSETAANGLALALTAGAAFGTWVHPVVHQFCLETVQETRKVVWPTRKETRDNTIIVVVVSIIFALMLWAFDQVWKQLFSLILDMGA